MYIFPTSHLGLRRTIRGSGEDDLRNLFSLYFLLKDENHLPCRRSFKYDSDQEIQTGTSEFSDVSPGELLKLHARERRTYTNRDGRGGGSNADHLRDLSEE